MALTRRLDQLRDAVMRTAAVLAFTERHPAVYVNDLINRGLGALNRVCLTTDPEFRPIGSSTFLTDGLSTMTSLPGNFRSLISVEYTADGRRSHLLPYELYERAALTTPDIPKTGYAHCYKVIGSNIELLPMAVAGHSVNLWYATTALVLTADGDLMDTFERLDDYVIWYAAREIAGELENWARHDRLTAKMTAMEADIRILARSRDLSAPSRIINQTFAQRDRYGRTRR